jgi:hypothetical protein
LEVTLGFLGIFKSKEEKDLDTAIVMMGEISARAASVIAHVERTFSPTQRQCTAATTVSTVMLAERDTQTIERLHAKIRQLGQDPAGEGPLHFGMGLGS